MHDSVTVHMNAPADRIWGLISDITNTGRFSPETFEAEWLDGATGPFVGARFRGHVKRNGKGPTYWTKCVVIASDPGKEFAFTVDGPKGKAVNTWRYQLTPASEGTGGTDVTESFQLAPVLPLKVYWAIMGRWRGKTNANGMRTTLERIKSAAEAESSAG